MLYRNADIIFYSRIISITYFLPDLTIILKKRFFQERFFDVFFRHIAKSFIDSDILFFKVLVKDSGQHDLKQKRVGYKYFYLTKITIIFFFSFLYFVLHHLP